VENLFFDKKDLKHCGENVIIGKTVRIRKPEQVWLGDNVIIDDFTYISCALRVGSFTHIGAGCAMIGGPGQVTVGSFVNIAPSCKVITASNDYKGGGLVGPAIPQEYAGEPVIKPVVIGDHALLGCNTVILPGAVVPEGMSTGAFTLVREGEYEPWALYLGIPANYQCPRDGTEMKRAAQRLLEEYDGRAVQDGSRSGKV